MSNTTNARIEHLRELLGPAVLLPWSARSKGDRRKWKHLELTDMDADYFANLQKAGNIGVALGAVSNGLVTIDIDDYRHVEPFLEANPLLRHTLRTAAQRGCNIWLRCTSDYPSSCKLKDQSEKEIGEWRADGSQTIIAGTHPEGMPYQFVVEKPVITIGYEAIIWPESITPPSCYREYESKRVREDEVVGVCCVNGVSLSKVGDLISQIAPRDFHQNNASLFNLARLVVSYQNAVGRLATEKELEFVFDRWCLLARSFWRHTRDDYWAEFLQAYHYARIGLDQDPLELALNCARAMPLPIVPGFSDERVRLLAAICRELQRQMRDGSFFLPTRKLGRVLGAHWGTVARWLVALEALGVIRKRGGTRCPRYQYCQSLDGEPQPKLGTVTVPQLNGGNGADEPPVSLADQYPQLGQGSNGTEEVELGSWKEVRK
jgi:hypothetical protein